MYAINLFVAILINNKLHKCHSLYLNFMELHVHSMNNKLAHSRLVVQ